MSEWYEIDAAWDVNEYASDALLKLGETREWGDLVDEASKGTHATAEEIWDGMAKALRDYLESLDGLTVFTPELKAKFAKYDKDCQRTANIKEDWRKRAESAETKLEAYERVLDSLQDALDGDDALIEEAGGHYTLVDDEAKTLRWVIKAFREAGWEES